MQIESGQDGNRTRISRLTDDNPQLRVPEGQKLNQGVYCFTLKLPAQNDWIFALRFAVESTLVGYSAPRPVSIRSVTMQTAQGFSL
jgi:hypothetical protein